MCPRVALGDRLGWSVPKRAAGHRGHGDTCGREGHDQRLAPLWPLAQNPAGTGSPGGHGERQPELPVTHRDLLRPPRSHPSTGPPCRGHSHTRRYPRALQGCDSGALGTFWQVGFGAGVRGSGWGVARPIPITSMSPSLLFVPSPPSELSPRLKRNRDLFLTFDGNSLVFLYIFCIIIIISLLLSSPFPRSGPGCERGVIPASHQLTRAGRHLSLRISPRSPRRGCGGGGHTPSSG